MIDPKLLRADIAYVANKLKIKGFDLDIELFLKLEKNRKTLQSDYESIASERNANAKAIGKTIAETSVNSEAVEQLKKAGEDLKSKSSDLERQLSLVKKELDSLLELIPNVPDDSVPAGNDEADNQLIREWGTIKTNPDSPDHVEIGLQLKQMDFEIASKITGSRFVHLNGSLASLHRAITQFMLDTHIHEHGYEEVYVPYIVNSASLWSTGQLPKFEDDQFKLDDDRGYYLIPTAEVPVTNIMRDRITNDLPLRYVAHTPCFRSEAGSYGKDTRGMIRQHQFEKVELVHFVEADKSWETFDQLVTHAENILKKLELPYRVVNLCGGDLGFSSAKTYDLEVWLPSQSTYREISSCSNFLDFQARRMKARYKHNGKVELLHTLNGSGLAVGRTLIAIMENYQCDNGKAIAIPDVLQKYMNGLKKISCS